MALALIADVMDITGETYSDDETWRLNNLLHIASREIKVFTGQKLERVSHTWKTPFRTKLLLPQGPDPEITTVRDLDGNDVTYSFNGYDTIYISNPGLVQFDLEPFFYSFGTLITVNYIAGYEFIPDDLKAICVQMALRAYGANPLQSGKTQESVTNYSYQQGQAAAAGAIGMLPMEQAALLPYKRFGRSIRTARA